MKYQIERSDVPKQFLTAVVVGILTYVLFMLLLG